MWDQERAYEDQGVGRGEQIHWGQLWFTGYQNLAADIGRSIARNISFSDATDMLAIMAEMVSESMYDSDERPDDTVVWDICGESDWAKAIAKEMRRAYDTEKANKEAAK